MASLSRLRALDGLLALSGLEGGVSHSFSLLALFTLLTAFPGNRSFIQVSDEIL